MSTSVSAPTSQGRVVRTRSDTSRLVYCAQVAGLAGAYYVAAKVGLRNGALTGNVTPVWPPTGLALAVLVLQGRRLWPGVFLGALAVNGLSAVPFVSAIGMATGNTLEALVGSFLLVSVAHFRPALDRVRDVVALAGLSAIIATAASATIGVASLRLGGVISSGSLGQTWRVWWVGDALGALVVAPVVMVWARGEEIETSARVWFESAALAVVVVVSATVAFSGHFDQPYLVFPGLLFAALHFRQRGAATATLVVSSIAVDRTIAGIGPFAHGSTTDSLWTLDVFLAVVALTGLLLAAVVRERDRADDEGETLATQLRLKVDQLQVANQDLEAFTKRLERSEERFHELVESAPDAMVCVSTDGRIAIVNREAERLFGYERSEMLGQPVEMLLPDAARAAHPVHRSSFLADPRARRMAADIPLSARRRDGTEFPAEISLSTIHLDGGMLVSAVTRDVTPQREAAHRLERALQDLDTRARELDRSNHDLEQFAYVASHDLREPLRAVRSFSQLLARRYHGELDGEGGEYLDFITDGASRMQSLIDDLLTYSRVRAAVAPATVPLRSAVDGAIANLRSAIPTDARVEIDAMPTVIADPAQATQLMQNLIGNALKFRSDAPPLVRISAEPTGSWWIISVSDNGIGIDARFADQIFIVFQRLHTRDEYPGTGIGLAICKKLVERWGGRIWVESELGTGATFRFTIPGAPA